MDHKALYMVKDLSVEQSDLSLMTPSFDALGGAAWACHYMKSRKGGFSEELTGVLNVPVIDDVLAVRLGSNL